MVVNQLQTDSHKSGMSHAETLVVCGVFAMVIILFGVFMHSTKRTIGNNGRAEAIMNIRNCQQAMRGEQNMRQFRPGDPFTREDLEKFMDFPENMVVGDGVIQFAAGSVITADSVTPAANGDHLWLRFAAPQTKGYVGKYGFKNISATTGW